MSGTYTSSNVVDMSKERDWAASIGMMDWDSTSIVFTKRTLLEFLKYTGTTVDTNYMNISKLPRYARFGKITETKVEAASSEAEAPEGTAVPIDTATEDGTGFKPTRRVRSPPGGETHDLFGHYVDDDALSAAPAGGQAEVTKSRTLSGASETSAPEVNAVNVHVGFKPTRRVREMPGGKDNLAGIL